MDSSASVLYGAVLGAARDSDTGEMSNTTWLMSRNATLGLILKPEDDQ
jgi:hypothetical protein